jgi:uncharacterized protein (TIGR02145 family)
MENFETIQIAEQIWGAKNLNNLTFSNGDKITLVTSLKEWKKLNISKMPACCYYEFDEKKFGYGGLLYNYYAIADVRGLAPEGYRIPSDKDWNTLVDFCGKKKLAGEALKANNGWESFGSANGNGKDEHGFSAIAIGYLNNRFGEELQFMNFEFNTVFWTSTLKKGKTNEVYYWQLNSGKSVERDSTEIEKDIMALSVRVIKN